MTYPDKATPEEIHDANVEFRLSGDGTVIDFVDHTHFQAARISYPRLLQWLRCEEPSGMVAVDKSTQDRLMATADRFHACPVDLASKALADYLDKVE